MPELETAEMESSEVDSPELETTEVDTVEIEPVEAEAAADDESAVEKAAPAVVEEGAAEEPAVEEAAPVVAEEGAAEADAGEDADDEEAAPTRSPSSPYDMPGDWYVIHSYSGYENKVKANLETRIQSMHMEDRIFEVHIPMEDVVEFKGGKKVTVPKKVFPGYLLVRCDLDDDSWYVIRNTPGVTGFVGQGAKPSPLRRRDVETFLLVKTDEQAEAAKRSAKPKLDFELGETVRVKEGPFADFSGQIIEINEDHLKVKVLVNIFGRETPVELEFSQVAKL